MLCIVEAQAMMSEKPHILVVDDDDRLRALLKKYLSEQSFMVTAASNAAHARRLMRWFRFDLAVLDVMMPGESGIDLLAFIRKENSLPVLMLSAMGEAQDRIKGLETGAEDYLSKPFEPKELVLRIETILRRQAASEEKSRVSFGEFRFDPATALLMRGDRMVHLTTGEAALLKALAERAGKTVSREELSRLMPGAASERSIDVQITRLRKKIEASERKPVYLQTVRGEGYVLYAGRPAT